MKIFRCDHCDNLIHFENTHCVQCNNLLAFIPELGVVASFDPTDTAGIWTTPLPRAEGQRFRLCQNYSVENVCNWAISESDPNPFCQSCRLTEVIPDLTADGNKQAWFKLEAAKRRLIYTLSALGLPVRNQEEDPERGLSFEFLEDPDTGPKVLTGHADGLITINLAEADDAEREKRRVQMHEPYRTLLGHFRHEVGHYYWDRLIRDGKEIEAFRKLFGDERADYGESLKKHYAEGPRPDWQSHFVTTYAAAHPWEDWAETWAHYLHIVDALETAADAGVLIRSRDKAELKLQSVPDPVANSNATFKELYSKWLPLSYILNALNRGLGYSDYYPFILPTPAVEKLRFVHEVIGRSTNGLHASPSSTI